MKERNLLNSDEEIFTWVFIESETFVFRQTHDKGRGHKLKKVLLNLPESHKVIHLKYTFEAG
jgi:hypothetical protein